MPVERMLTPRPDDRDAMARMEKAKAFIDCVIKFFSDTNQIYKFFLFGYITLMMLFVFIVDSKTYNFKEMGNEVYGAVAVIEASLGAACILAVFGLVRTRTMYLVPLLCLQMMIFMYGFVYYLYPYAQMQQNHAILELGRNSKKMDAFTQLLIFAKSLFMIVLRMCPLFVQFLFTAFTLKVVVCIAILENNDNYTELPMFELQSSSSSKISCNSHIWSSMQRKVSSRRREENLDQVSRVPKREFVCEMSAKFRRSTFPKPLPLLSTEVDIEV